MRAALFLEQNGPLVVEDVTPTAPGPRDVLVHITASGVCHSDVHVISGALPMPPPAILGHEGCGVVEAVGSEVTRVKVGDRVIGSFIPACGACWFCLRDESHLCANTYAVMGAPRATRRCGGEASQARLGESSICWSSNCCAMAAGLNPDAAGAV